MRTLLALGILALTAWGQDAASLEHDLANGTHDPGLVTYFLARNFTLAGRKETALTWIRRLVDLDQGFDPSESPTLSRLSSDPTFQALVRKSHNPPVIRRRTAFTVRQKALVTEGLAYDPESRAFYLGDIPGRTILRIAPDGSMTDFISSAQYGFGGPVRLKVDPKGPYGRTRPRASRRAFIISTCGLDRRLIKSYTLDGNHMFNDLALMSAGDVYLTDTNQGAVYRITRESDRLERYLPTESRSRRFRLVFGWSISGAMQKAIEWPPGLTLCGIDGLYVHRYSLIAIQNAGMAPRVARFCPEDKMARIEKMEILELKHPAYDVPTTGAILGDDFYYVANSQLRHIEGDRLASPDTLRPVVILKRHL